MTDDDAALVAYTAIIVSALGAAMTPAVGKKRRKHSIWSKSIGKKGMCTQRAVAVLCCHCQKAANALSR